MFRKLIALILQISLITSTALAAPDATPSSTAPDGSDWKKTCEIILNKEEAYKTYTSETCRKNQKCAAEARAAVEENFGQVGPKCHAAELAHKGKAMEITSAAVYGAAAATCAVACATTWLGDAGHSACTGVGAGATVLDLGMTIGLTVQKMKFHDWYQTKDGKAYTGMQWGSTAAGAAATGASTAVNVKDITVPLINKTIKGTGEKGAKATKNSGKSGSCIAAALLGLTTALKGMAIGKSKKVGDAAAQGVQELTSSFTTTIKGLDAKYPPPTPGQGFQGLGGTTQNLKAGTSSGEQGEVGGLDNNLLENGNPQTQAVMGGPIGDLIKNLGPPGSSKSALDRVGFDPQKFASNLASGMSPSAAMAGSAPGMPGEALQMMKELEDLAQSGQVAMNEMPATTYASTAGAAAPTGEAQKDASPFMPTESITDSGASIEFTRTPASDEDSTDIWHRNFQGTIFEIISNRIAKAKPEY